MTIVTNASATGPSARIALHLATLGDNPVSARLIDEEDGEVIELHAADLAAMLDTPDAVDAALIERVTVYLDAHDRQAQQRADRVAIALVVPRTGCVAPLRVLDVDALINQCDRTYLPEYIEEHAGDLWEAATGDLMHSQQSARSGLVIAGIEIPDTTSADGQVSYIGRHVVMAGHDVPDAHRVDD